MDPSKIVTIEEFKRNLPLNHHKTIAFTNGCFDLLHIGHLDLLSRIKTFGDIIIIGLNSDSSVKKLKGELRPINNQQIRSAMLSCLSCVDYIIIFDDVTPYELIKRIKPDVLIKGGDWPLNLIVGSDIVNSYDGEVYALPFNFDISTTKLIERIKTL